MKTLILIIVALVAISAYAIGREDYKNEVAVLRSVVNHHQKEAEFFYTKWREEESAHFKTKRERK